MPQEHTYNPENARRLSPAIPEDLRVVLDTALVKVRDRRYRTALDLAEEIRRVREHEPIHARPVGTLVRLRRCAERKPALAASHAFAFLALSAGLAVSVHLLGQARSERDAKEASLSVRGSKSGSTGQASNRVKVRHRDGLRSIFRALETATPDQLDVE